MPNRRDPGGTKAGSKVFDRLRGLADCPLDRRVARAVLILGLAATIGTGVVVALAGVEKGGNPDAPSGHDRAPVRLVQPRAQSQTAGVALARRRVREQDPQDRRGTAARRRAVAELGSHRALQHVPYRSGRVSIVLAGAQARRAVLRVTAPTPAAARRGWREFLRRFDDRGSAYLPRFRGGRRDG